MAKTSAIQKNLKRIKLVKKYSKKRAALKKIINNNFHTDIQRTAYTHSFALCSRCPPPPIDSSYHELCGSLNLLPRLFRPHLPERPPERRLLLKRRWLLLLLRLLPPPFALHSWLIRPLCMNAEPLAERELTPSPRQTAMARPAKMLARSPNAAADRA